MNIHKRTKRTPQQREEIYRRHHTEHIRVALLAEEYHVSCPTIYEIRGLWNFYVCSYYGKSVYFPAIGV